MKTFIHVDGIHDRLNEERITTAMRNRNGKLDGVTDKGAVFAFDDADDAWAFRHDCRQLKVPTRETN
jgi:hypothetical protein